MNLCNAKTRNGGTCKRPGNGAGGRCHLHGGKSTGRPIVTGRYSVVHRASLADKLAQFRADPQPGNLSDELALLRALFADYLERFPTGTPLKFDDVERLAGLLVEVSKMVERISRIMNSTALTAAEVAYLQARMADLVQRYIPDPDRRDAFLLELSASLEGSRPL